MKFSRILGVLLIVAGVGLVAYAYLGSVDTPAFFFAGVTLLFIGVINVIVWQFVSKLTKNIPMRSMGEAMADAANQMTNMRNQMDNRERVGRLRSEGLLGKATVLSVTDTGAKVSGDPVMRYELSIELSLYPVYTVTHEQFTPQLMLPQITPGKIFDVRVDKEDQQNLNIEWV